MLSEQQLKERVGKITSSIAAGALGVNPKMTPLEAWMRVTGRIGLTPPSKATERGDRLEQITLDYVAEELGLVRKRAGFRQRADLPWAGDSADALYFSTDDCINPPDGRVIPKDGAAPMYCGEAKTVAQGVAPEYGAEGTDAVAAGALVQSHWHLLHWPELKGKACLVPILVGGYAFEFRHYVVRRDEKFESAIIEDLARWHRDYVVAGKAPPAARPEDTEHLLALKPNATLGLAPPTADLEALVFAEAKRRKDEAESDEDMLKTKIRELLGEHAGAREPHDRWSIRYTRNKPSISIDWEGVARELGINDPLVQRHTHTKPGNRPLIVTVKE